MSDKGPSNEEIAANYGFSVAFLNSDRELKSLFGQAVKGNWTTDRFVAKLRATKWYKRNGESVRQYEVLRTTDPATLAVRRNALLAQIKDMSAQLGAVVPTTALRNITENALRFNWNDSQLRDVMAGYVRAVNGVYSGAAGDNVEKLRQVAWRNGVQMSSSTLQSAATQIANGTSTLSFQERVIRKLAKSVAPAFSDELDAGMDLFDIANPYIQAKARLLEMNPADLDLFDRDIRGALGAKGADGKPTSRTLWQFENDIRNTPAWLKTKNAQDEVMGVARKVLTDFGIMS